MNNRTRQKIIMFILCISSFWLISAKCSQDLGTIKTQGIGFWPLDYSPNVLDKSFTLLKEGSDLVIVQRNVFETEHNQELHRVYDAWLDRGAKAGLKKYIGLEPFDGSRRFAHKPNGWSGDTPLFSSPSVRDAFEMEVLKIVDRHKPSYLNLGVEVNMYYVYKPDDYKHFLTLFQSVRAKVKMASPDTKVFVSFQYEILRGIAPFMPGKSQWTLLEAIEQDLIGISSYPKFLVSPYFPESIPNDYFQELGKRFKLPIFIAEIGWYSSFVVVPSSSRINQAKFIGRLPSLFDGLPMEAVCWVNIADLPDIPALEPLKKTSPQFFTLGLVDSKLRSKPAWTVWKALRE